MRFAFVSVILILVNWSCASPNCSALSCKAIKTNCLMSVSNWTTIFSILSASAFGPKTSSHAAKSETSSSLPQTYKRAPNADKLASNRNSTGEDKSKFGDRRMKRGVISSRLITIPSKDGSTDDENFTSLEFSWRLR